MILRLTEAATVFAVDLDEVKNHLRVDFNDDDDDLTSMIEAASDLIEAEANIALGEQSWELVLREFPPAGESIRIPRPPLASVESVKYRSPTDGALVELDDAEYLVIKGRRNGLIEPAFGKTWPSSYCSEEGVIIEFTCGAVDAANIRPMVGKAIKNIVATWYRTRETEGAGEKMFSLKGIAGVDRIIRILKSR